MVIAANPRSDSSAAVAARTALRTLALRPPGRCGVEVMGQPYRNKVLC
jgi:hypothetical protein